VIRLQGVQFGLEKRFSQLALKRRKHSFRVALLKPLVSAETKLVAMRTEYGYGRTIQGTPLIDEQGHLSIRKKRSANDELETPTKVWTTRCNAGAVRRAGRRLLHMYDIILAPTGLKQCQYGILSALNARGAALPSVQELAEELVLDRSTLGQNLRPLERDNFVTLLTDPRDRRVRLIALSKLGIAKFNEAKPYWQKAQERFEEVFGTEEAAKLRSVLLSIAYNPELGKPRMRANKLSLLRGGAAGS
jgi:DNA-binding MarR family transcriptional regulator